MNVDELYRAIKRGDLETVEVALDGGVDVNLCNKYGHTPLMEAARTGNTVIGKLLIERGASLNARTHFPRSNFQNTPLSVAIISGKPSFVRLLLESGASLDASPYPGTLESYIEWVERYSAVTPEQVANLRSVVDAERQRRIN